MNRERSPRSFGRSSSAPRIRPTRTTRRPARTDHRRPVAGSADGAILSLLSEVLIGDSAWTLAEVQRLIAVRELADLGRWRAAGLDDAATAS